MRTWAIAAIAAIGGVAIVGITVPASSVKVNGHVGEMATVEGVVSEVHVAATSGVTFIDLGGRYPDNSFTGVIWPENADTFPNVGALYGKTVKITGLLKLYRGKQEIILTEADQLQSE